MVANQLLHSGSFVDFDNDIIEVKFFQKADLNADPTLFSVGGAMSTNLLLIWSRDGEAYIKSTPNFVSCTQIWQTEIPGTPYHMFYISVFISENTTGADREGNIKVGIQYNNWAELDVPVHQDAAVEPAITINASPASFTFEQEEFRSVYLEVSSPDGEAIVTSYPDWMYCAMVGVPHQQPGSLYHIRIYAISAMTNNTGEVRYGTIKVGLQDISWAELDVPITQYA